MPPLDELPDDVTALGTITVTLYMNDVGTSFGYLLDGMSREAALGYLIAVSDRIRDDIKYDWSDSGEEHGCLGPECPACGFSTDSLSEEDPDDA